MYSSYYIINLSLTQATYWLTLCILYHNLFSLLESVKDSELISCECRKELAYQVEHLVQTLQSEGHNLVTFIHELQSLSDKKVRYPCLISDANK